MQIKKVISLMCFALLFLIPSISTPFYYGSIVSNDTHITAYGDEWLEGFNYRKKIQIDKLLSTNDGTFYSKKFNVEYGSGTDSVTTIHCNNHCKTNFSDIRFTELDGATELDYWICRYTDSANASIWVEIEDDVYDQYGVGIVVIYMYYGNPTAETTSNGTETFLYFDDFENGLTQWTTSNMEIKTDQYLQGAHSAGVTNTALDAYMKLDTITLDEPIAIHCSVYADESLRGAVLGTYTEQDESESVVMAKTSYEAEPSKMYYYDGAYQAWTDSDDDIMSDEWFDFEIRLDFSNVDPDMRGYHNEGNAYILNYDGEEDFHTSADIDPTNKEMEWFRLVTQANYQCWFDNFFIRKSWYLLEPLVSDYGEEETVNEWNIINSPIVFILCIAPYTRIVDIILVIGGLCMLPISTVYLAYNRKNMDQDKVFYFLILFLMGWGLFIGGIWP